MRHNRSGVSRREWLAAMAAGAALVRQSLRAAATDPHVERIVADTIAVDMHSHVQIGYGAEGSDQEIDLAGQMKRAGFAAVCQTYNLDRFTHVRAGEYYRHHLEALTFEDRLLERNGMRRALNGKDLEAAHARRQPVIVQSTEGAQFIEGRLERLEESYRRGLRHLQLVHEQDDVVKPLGDVYTTGAHLGGLTPFGSEVVKACNRLGILLDMAHGTDETVEGALGASAQPLIISHTGLRGGRGARKAAPDFAPRLIRQGVARAVAEAGGAIGVWWRLSDTVRDYVEAIREMVEAVGADHVGIGTDSDLSASYVLPYTNQIWPDENGGFSPAIVAEMLRQGFTAEEIGKIAGGNFRRVFGKATGG